MSNITFVHVLAARPNFIKAAPLIEEISNNGYNNVIIHTNQHYDFLMSNVFFGELNIPEPDYNLGVKSGTHAEQTANAMIEIERVLLGIKIDFLVVYGDVNSSLAAALVGSKLNIRILHIESGCRSFDKSMPEEINRIVIDNLSDLLFCTEESACNNLAKSSFSKSTFFNVGNTAIDTLTKLSLKNRVYDFEYYLCTLHRPFNVDDPKKLGDIMEKLNGFDKKVIMPVHPRTKRSIKKSYTNIVFVEPLSYSDFISLMKYSSGAISDSGGVQCEAACLRIPMLTLRQSTEHILTLNYGNQLISLMDLHYSKFKLIDHSKLPEAWDGMASKRILKIVKSTYKI